MYADYLSERSGKEVLETDKGFLTYGFNCLPGVDFPHVYIEDLYVKPEFRKSHVASIMADGVAELAKMQGIKIMLGSVDCGAKNADASLRVLQAYGMKLYTANQNAVYMVKEI